MPKATRINTTSPPGPFPPWSVAEIGRRIAALEDAHTDADDLKLQARDTALGQQRHAEDVMRFANDRLEALKATALSMPGETLADAVTHGLLALEEVDDISSNELEPYQLYTAYRRIQRALVSMVIVVAAEAAIDPATVHGHSFNWKLERERAFPAGGVVG